MPWRLLPRNQVHLGFLSEDADVRDHGREPVWPPLYTTGSFDLTTGEGSQAPYTAQELNASNLDAITWKVNIEVDVTPFGMADSASTFSATRKD
jgi:hypothetical protein